MRVAFLQTPSPPGLNVKRDYAGGMGVADASARATYGHDPGYIALPYMSLLYSTAVLDREGHDVVFIDGQADGLDLDALGERVAATDPEVLVAVVNLPSIYGDLDVLQTLKKRFPALGIVTVGTVCIPLYEVIAASGGVDAIVRGDPEIVLPNLVAHLAAGAKATGDTRLSLPDGFELRHGVLTNHAVAHVEDLNALPDLPYHLVPIEKYWYHGFGKDTRYAAVFASRGCSFKCYYCPYPMGFGDCIVHRDPVRVVDEIEHLVREHGVHGILFRDQVFTMDWDKTQRLCDELIRRRLDVEWVIETRLDRVNADLLRKMKQAGCKRIHYGLESGDPKLFSRVGKDGAEDRMERLIENFRLTEAIGIHPHMFVLIGLTGETWQTIANTIRVIRRIRPLTLQVAIVTPYPGTALFDEKKAKGLLLTEDWSHYTGFQAVARTEALSAEDLSEARNRIIGAQRRAVFWKARRRELKLAGRYLLDGSLPRRVWRRWRESR
mgnify:CR=1 FL=1